MTKSNMRIYKGRGYSDHEINLYIAVDMEDVYFLHIKTLHEEITLPDSVTWIGQSAFLDCGCLTALDLPSGLTTTSLNQRGLTP